MTAYVDPQLAVSARVQAAREGRTTSDIVGAALEAYLGGANGIEAARVAG